MDSIQKNILSQMTKVSKAVLKAKENEGNSVVYVRKQVLDEAITKLEDNPNSKLTLFGIKNTGEIDEIYSRKLQKKSGYLFHTIDKMAEGGRAIDVDLINPLTGKVMSGSSSGGCVNILMGINDFAIGTDGGGSVLAPAMSTGLYSIMGKGMGLMGRNLKKSTDQISFIPGIGVISHSYEICKLAIAALLDKDNLENNNLKKLKVVVPKHESIKLPHGKDMRLVLENVINEIQDSVTIIEKDFKGIEDRHKAISLCKDIFEDDIDIIITAEGPIDLYGLGDSVLGTWGEVGSNMQNDSGKYLLKIANMIDSTAVTIPTGELGMAILIIARKGFENGKLAIELGDRIKQIFNTPKLFESYFIEEYNKKANDYF